MHFPVKQPCTNDTVCNAAMQVDGSMEKKWHTIIPADLIRLFVSGTRVSRWSQKG